MNSGDELYFVLSRVDPSGRGRMAELRAEHLEYVLAMRERVQHGGLLAGADGPEAISMILSATSRDEILALTALDPYRELYSSVEVSRFIQRVPEAYDGELEALLDQARDSHGGSGGNAGSGSPG